MEAVCRWQASGKDDPRRRKRLAFEVWDGHGRAEDPLGGRAEPASLSDRERRLGPHAARMIKFDPRTFRRWRQIVDGRDPEREPDEYLAQLFVEIDAVPLG
jgi:hypothetical protein